MKFFILVYFILYLKYDACSARQKLMLNDYLIWDQKKVNYMGIYLKHEFTNKKKSNNNIFNK